MKNLGVAALAAAGNLRDELAVPPGARADWGPNDAPILIVLGQSNSYGHGTLLPAGEQITTPMPNVFTLSRPSLYNLTFTQVSWVGMTTLGEHNIATPAGSTLGAQDHTAHLANEFARLWQAHISAGNALGLPNLRVILAGWGSQGMHIGASHNRWAPERASSDVESLYHRITRTVRLAIADLKAQGFNPRILAVHWNQWETEASATISPANSGLLAQENFGRMVRGFNDALGCDDAPWVFYNPVSRVYGDYGRSGGVDTKPEQVRRAVLGIVAADPSRRRLMDPTLAPNFTGVGPNFGIFVGDNVHYNATTQRWFGAVEFARIQAGIRGVTCGRWPHGTQGLAEMSARAVSGVSQAQVDASISAATRQVAWRANESAVGGLPAAAPLPATSFSRVGTDMTLTIARDAGITPTRKVVRPTCPSGGNKQGYLSFARAPSDARYGRVRLVARGRLPLAVAFRARPNTVNSFQGLGFAYAALAFYDFGSLTTTEAFRPNRILFFSLPSTAVGFLNATGSAATAPAGYVVDDTVWREWEFGLVQSGGGTAYIQYRAEGEAAWTVIYTEGAMDAKLTTAGLTEGGIGLVFGLGINDGATQAASWANTYGALNIREFEFIAAD